MLGATSVERTERVGGGGGGGDGEERVNGDLPLR